MNYSTKIATNIKQRIHLTFLAKPQVKILYCHILYFCEHLINIFLVLFVFVLLPTCQRWSPPQRYGHCFCGRGGPWPAGFHLSPSPTDERRTRWAARSSLQNETVKTHFKDIVCEDKIRSICICWDHPEKIKTCQGTIWCSKDYRYSIFSCGTFVPSIRYGHIIRSQPDAGISLTSRGQCFLNCKRTAEISLLFLVLLLHLAKW